MAQHKQALKRHRQSLKRNERNQHYTSMLRTYVKRARAAIAENPATAGEAVRKAASIIDRVSAKGIIPARTASRKIGRIMKAHAKALAE